MRWSPMTRDAAKFEPVGELQAGLALDEERQGLSAVELRHLVEAEIAVEGRQHRGRNQAADDALAVIRLETVDAAIVIGQAAPDRQEKAGGDVQRQLREFGEGGDLVAPRGGDGGGVGVFPRRLLEHVRGQSVLIHRTQQAHAAFDRAVVEHEARRGDQDGAASGARIAHRPRAAHAESIVKRQGAVALLAQDGEDLRLGSGLVGVDRAAGSDGQRFRRDRLKALVVDSGRDRAFDARLEELLEDLEDRVLQGDRQRQDAVEEGGDGRQLVPEPALIRQREAGRILKLVQAAGRDLAGEQQHVELAQRIAGVMRFQIVVGAEQALPAGLALALGDGAERVEAARDRRQETLLALDVGGDGTEQRRLRLVGAVRAAEPLDGGVGAPAGFEHVMDAKPLIPDAEIRMVGAAGAAGVGEHQDALVVILEGLRLGEVGRSGAVLHGQAVDAVAAELAQDAARAAGDFGDLVGAEAVQDLVEGGRDGRQRGEMLHERVAPFDGLAAHDRIAVAEDRARGEIALFVGIFLEQLHREGVHEVVEHVFARRDVDLDVVPVLGRDVGQAAFHQRLAGRDDLDDGGMAVFEILVDGPDQRRRLHRRDEVREEALLGGFKGGTRRGLGLRVQRSRRAGDAGRLHRSVEMVMDDAESAGIGVVDGDLLVGELMLDELVLDAFIGQRAGGIEAERLQVAGQDFHGGDPAGLDRLDEFGAGGEGEILAAPQAEALRVSQVLDLGRAGGGDVDDAGLGQSVLQPQACAALLRGGDGAAVRTCRRRRWPWRAPRRRR